MGTWRGWFVGSVTAASAAAVACGGAGACSGREAPAPEARPALKLAEGLPVGLQLLRTEAQVKRYPFRALQTFEGEVDLAFLAAEGGTPALDASRPHTGRSAAALPAGTRSVTIRLPSLLSGVEWPGPWTLAGAYLYAERPQRITATYEVGGKAQLTYRVELPAGRWAPVLLDLASLPTRPEATAEVGVLRLAFDGALPRPLWLDDVLIMNNAETLVPAKGRPAGAWSVRQRGFRYTVEYPTRMARLALVGREADARGWTLLEVSPLRVRFASAGGPERSLVLYHDGRRFVDGAFRPLGPAGSEAAVARQHAEPGEVDVEEGAGRVVRNAAGDRDNDGYVEARGAFRLEAGGGRARFTFRPKPGVPVTRPVFEVAGLPAGTARADVEGRPLDDAARLPDGTLLLELPGTYDRPATVSVRVLPAETQSVAP